MNHALAFGRELCGEFGLASRREWLVTNGIGGFAAGTIAGCQTRRYHGLLIAAGKPPVGRTALLVDLDVTVQMEGDRYELACHEYADGTVHPHGYRLIESFTFEGTAPTWTYATGATRLVKRIFMERGRNTTFLCWTLERALAPVELLMRPLCTSRDYHSQRHGAGQFRTTARADGCEVQSEGTDTSLFITVEGGDFKEAPDFYWNMRHRLEAERGLDAEEDLYTPGVFHVTLEPGQTVCVRASTARAESASSTGALQELRRYEAQLVANAPDEAPAWIRQLLLAADQFVVSRKVITTGEVTSARTGTSVIAGYPWFGDWGRDTMIALPGLTLATGRPQLAADVLRTFASHVRHGLLPNRFPDAGEEPEYNTVDATLWFLVAAHEYLKATKDAGLIQELFPVLLDIFRYHDRGTLHGIGVDPADGLLHSGEAGVQLTWMDAKVGDWVVTPRTGKVVEINALWFNALKILAAFARLLGKEVIADEHEQRASLVSRAFAARFWNSSAHCLYDVIDAPHGVRSDASIRPNQLIALSLPHPLLEKDRAAAVLAVCERELLTSYGLRTLSPKDSAYRPYYGGDQHQRDGAYHQGTVWPWLLGTFALAHFAIHGNRARALSYLAPIEHHLADACVGQVSEIFDAEAPHRPQGCFAQAWSVAEVLRAWVEIRGTPNAASPSNGKADLATGAVRTARQ